MLIKVMLVFDLYESGIVLVIILYVWYREKDFEIVISLTLLKKKKKKKDCTHRWIYVKLDRSS